MGAQLSPDGAIDIHVVVPTPWKTYIENRARKNRRSFSEEVRETLRLAYRLETPHDDKNILLPEGLAVAQGR